MSDLGLRVVLPHVSGQYITDIVRAHSHKHFRTVVQTEIARLTTDRLLHTRGEHGDVEQGVSISDFDRPIESGHSAPSM